MACDDGADADQLPAATCNLPPYLQFSVNSSATASPPSASPLSCPQVMLSSFLTYTASLPSSLLPYITMPFPQPSPPGSVLAWPSFSRFYNCTCLGGSALAVSSGVASCSSPAPTPSSSNTQYIIAIVLVAVLPICAFILGTVLFMR